MTTSVVSPDKAAPDKATPAAPQTLNDVPGWFKFTDQLLFRWLLRFGGPGDLVELGVYQGKSAIHMGTFLRPGEKLTVCDLFDLAGEERQIREGARRAYADLTQESFERNYLAFLAQLPTVVRGLTSEILDHVEDGSCRFIHIDASHMYAHVRDDARAARQLLQPDGVVVFDDYRTEHTPGTAAAVWESMATDGLQVLAVTANKFYGTWGDPTALRTEIVEQVARRTDHRIDFQDVMGQQLLRVVRVPKPAPKPASRRPDETPPPRSTGRQLLHRVLAGIAR